MLGDIGDLEVDAYDETQWGQQGDESIAHREKRVNVKNGRRTQAHGRSEPQKRPSDYGSRNASNKNDEPGHSQVHGAFLFCEDGRVSNDWRRKLDYFPGCCKWLLFQKKKPSR